MDAAEAKQAVRRQLLAPLRHSLRVGYDGKSWELRGQEPQGPRRRRQRRSKKRSPTAATAGCPAAWSATSPAAASTSRSPPTSPTPSPRSTASSARSPRRRPRSRRTPTVEPDRRLARSRRRQERAQAARQAAHPPAERGGAERRRRPHDRRQRPLRPSPEVTTSEVASEYPSYLTLDRGTFTLRLWKDLKLAKTYTVAVGQEGLETPEGLYDIQEKEENPTWHVPESAWAGEPRRSGDPAGPVEPDQGALDGDLRRRRHPRHRRDLLARARRLARLRADVDPRRDELYDQVEVGTPIYIG